MVRGRVGMKAESSSDDELLLSASASGRATPSTAATSVSSFKRPSPKTRTLKRSKVESSGSESDEVVRPPAKRRNMGTPQEMAESECLESRSGSIGEDELRIDATEESENDAKNHVKSLANQVSIGKGKGKTRASNPKQMIAKANVLSKKFTSALKGKGKQLFHVEIPTVTTTRRGRIVKSRTVSTAASSDEVDEDEPVSSDFNPDSVGEATEPEDDGNLSGDLTVPEEPSESEEEKPRRQSSKKLTTAVQKRDAPKKLAKRASDIVPREASPVPEPVQLNSEEEREASKVPIRPGREITKNDKRELRSLTKAERTEWHLKHQHEELRECWKRLEELPKYSPVKAEQPEGITQSLLPFQLEGLNWMIKQEKTPWAGGMLADEMGMGKTIQTISLILSDHDPNEKKHTLVLAPTVAIIQWKNEIEKFTKGMKVLVFHGASRISNKREMEKYDIVLTSYAVLESCHRRQHKGFKKQQKLMKEDSILHMIKWHRVILDEAHNIKDRASNTTKASFALSAQHRWCLSGTPLQNRVGELYSLIRFLGADPFSYYFCKRCDCKSLHWLCTKGPCTECGHSAMQHVCYWNTEILRPIQLYGATSSVGEVAFKKLTTMLERMMLRRTKVERSDDLGLPPRVVNVRRDYFTEEEEEMYQSLFKDVKRKFSTYADEGTVLNNYSNIFTLITRMRQSADHPSLVTHSRTAIPVVHAPGDEPEDLIICRLCLDEAEDAISSSCRHIFCRECARQYLETAIEVKPQCPVCHANMTIDLDQEAMEQDNTGRQGFLARINPMKDRTSTKIEALLEELSKLRAEDHTLKSLVFSQFTSMLDLVARRLQLAGFRVVRLQGSMTPTARDNTIKYFMETPEVTVFLISLKAGGVALNLVEASRVFILDPWWNPAVELQAMDRIHRLGQHRPVVVTRLIIENSIESRILELQRKKENLASSALGDDDKAMNRLTPEDLRFLFSL